jgi:hypothetical protein
VTHILVGTVCSGRGVAREHLDRHAADLGSLLGAPPVPGSLNLVLRRPVGFDFQQCRLAWKRQFFWAASVAGVPALAYRWLSCPLHIVEIVAPVMLRTTLGASDGDKVSITVEGTTALTPQQYLVWSILWGLRQHSYHASARQFPGLKRFRKYATQKSMGPPLHTPVIPSAACLGSIITTFDLPNMFG